MTVAYLVSFFLFSLGGIIGQGWLYFMELVNSFLKKLDRCSLYTYYIYG